MYLFIQTTLIHLARINITIIRSKVNENRNNFVTKLIIHLDNRCLVICLHVIQCNIDMWNALPNIPNCMCFMCTVDLRHITLILLEISLEMLLTTCPTFQLSLTITFVLLPSKLRSMSPSNYIKLLVRNDIIFLTYILGSCSLWLPFTFSIFFPLPTLLRFFPTLDFL